MASLEQALADLYPGTGAECGRDPARRGSASLRAPSRHRSSNVRHSAPPDGLGQLQALVAQEARSYGWSYLAGEPGRAAEAAFEAFARNTNIAPPVA
jgi:hypothetical protein